MSNILDNESLYNVIVFGGLVSPGQVTLSGHDRKIAYDVRWGPYLNGSRVALKGVPPVEFTAEFFLLRDTSQGIDDFAKWPAFSAKLMSTIGRPPKALPIYHPDLLASDIKSAVLAKLGGMTYDSKGGARIRVEFQECRIVKASGGVPTPKPDVDPNADIKARIDALTKQYAATGFG
jgi:hypothetical protein